jgi:DNA-binding beta-propeller fold protein YncE
LKRIWVVIVDGLGPPLAPGLHIVRRNTARERRRSIVTPLDRPALARLAIALLAALAAACSAAGDGMLDSAGSADMDVDSDGDTDTDADTDTDTDVDTDTGTDSDTAPEEEEEADYMVPEGSGRYVFIADAAHDAVAVVDSETLLIEVVEVGARPTQLVALGEENAAAVINLDSDELTILRVGDDGVPTAVDVDLRPDTNAIVGSEGGAYVIAYYDARFAAYSGAPGTDQEISVVDTAAGAEHAHHMTVGMHPQRVQFNAAATRAFVVNDEGINVIALDALDGVGIPPLVELFDPVFVDPATWEIAIDPSGQTALGFYDGSAEITTAALDGADDVRSYTLHGAPTDLDIAADGSYGMFVLREQGEIALFDLPLPADPLADPFTYVSVGALVCGVATITPDGNTAILYTTTGGDDQDQRVLTTMTRDGAAWALSSALLERKIKSVAASPDGATAVVMHEQIAPAAGELAFAYSLVALAELQIKFQQVPVAPDQLLLTPDGGYGFTLLRDDASGLKETQVMNLSSFIVDALELGSPPTALGYASGTNSVFIAQDHPSGRMTFIDLDDMSVQTVTGYTLN